MQIKRYQKGYRYYFMKKYKAFGLILESEFVLPQVTEADSEEQADVTIVHSDLSGYSIPDGVYDSGNKWMILCIKEVATFRVSDGIRIEVDVIGGDDHPMIPVYLLGSSMGAIIHQRGLWPIHGSCVTNGKYSVIFTGNSGAGKSTIASEFLHNGWKLLTDDVAVLKNLDDVPTVQSSYPSQKLWQDSLAQYREEKEEIHSLYARDAEQKYGVSVNSVFQEGMAPLSLIVRLAPMDDVTTQIKEIDGFAKVDQLMRNTYRSYMIEKDMRQKHFQRCVDLSQKIPMALVIRKNGEQCAAQMYQMITEFLVKSEINL